MIITPFDDYCIHQSEEPLAVPTQSDRNFYDRYWFNGYNTAATGDGADYLFEIGLGAYPNRYVMDGHFSVVIDGVQHSLHASRRCPEDRSQTDLGPLHLSVEQPLRQLRVRVDENVGGISCDLLFSANSAPMVEPKNLLSRDIRRIMYNSRFTQFGNWSGWIKVGGTRIEVRADVCLGTRDKSWGVRPVGEPEGGAPPVDQPEPRVYWIWAPLSFSDVCTHFGSFEDADGHATQLSGCFLPRYADMAAIPESSHGHPGLREMQTVRHRVVWEPGTRRPRSVEFDFCEADGVEHNITAEVDGHFHMHGIGYQHPEWGHAIWHGESKVTCEQWRLDELDPLQLHHVHQHARVRARMGDQEGHGLVETVVLGPHAPSGFRDFLDGAAQ